MTFPAFQLQATVRAQLTPEHACSCLQMDFGTAPEIMQKAKDDACLRHEGEQAAQYLIVHTYGDAFAFLH